MTRKRYVKLLMGAGVHRNTANRNAAMARRVELPYQRFYDEIMSSVLYPKEDE